MSQKQIHFKPSSLLVEEHEGRADNVKTILQTLAVAAASGVAEVNYAKILLTKVLNLFSEEIEAVEDHPLIVEVTMYLKTGEFTHPDEAIAAKLAALKSKAPLAEKL